MIRRKGEVGRTRYSSLSILAIFFHPRTHVTAMGGAEKRFVETFKILSTKTNNKVVVLESSPSLLVNTKTECKKCLVSSGFQGRGWLGTYVEWIVWMTRAFLKSCSIMRSEKPNIVFVANNTLPNLMLACATSLVFERPVCVVAHHIDVPTNRGRLKACSFYDGYRSLGYSREVSLIKTLATYVAFPFLRKARKVIAVSNFTATILKNYGISGRKVLVSGNAIDLDFTRKVRPHSNERIFDGVFVGRIAKEKGIFDLVKVWRKVVEKADGAKLLIIGSGLELPTLKKMIRAEKLGNNVLIRGRCKDEELYGLLKSSRAFIFPSLFEGWGISVAEALACGTAVVAYKIPALREIFGKCKSVFLMSIGDTDGMAEIVVEILRSDHRNFAESSTKYVERFEWNKVAMMDLKAIVEAAKTN